MPHDNTVPDNRRIAITVDALIYGKTLLVGSLDVDNVKIGAEKSFNCSLSWVYADGNTTEYTSDFQSIER
jgi:hypothetical protein